jgi:thiamine biosynthesis protein ThiI
MTHRKRGQPAPREFVSLTLSGEFGIKVGASRNALHRQLRANVKAALARHGHRGRIRDRKDRIDIEGVDASAVAPLARVFGVRAARLVQARPWRGLEDIVAAGTALYADAVAGRRFAVRPRRVGPRARIRVSGEDVARALGRRLVETGGRVDLDDPEVRLRVEVRPDDVLFFHEKVPGPGGVPLGAAGRGLALISGGFDSAVAAWEMMRRGVALDFLLFNLAGPPQEQPVREVLHRLDRDWMAGADPRLFVVDFRPVIADLRQHAPGRYWQVLLKRLMMRAADVVAREHGAEALVTGEALGQVSSQTLPNLGAVAAHSRTLVLRPLLGREKDEIVAAARRIGTADISAAVQEFCALDGPAQAFRVSHDELDRLEATVDLARVERLAGRAREIPRTAFAEAIEGSPEIDHVPGHAAVLDLRSEAEHAEWAWPDAIHMEFDKAMEHAHRLPGDRAYLLYCEVGLKSAYLAQAMREAGFEAYSFRGGAGPMQVHARRTGAEARPVA